MHHLFFSGSLRFFPSSLLSVDLLSFFSCLIWWGIFVILYFTMKRIPRLTEVALDDAMPRGEELPTVYVVVPARDEEKSIAKSLRSLLAIDYPDLHVVAINDRSTDGTGAILQDLAHEIPRLHLVHIETLPPGWSGKNYACHRASLAIATLSQKKAPDRIWILFSDGDVFHTPDSLLRSIRLALKTGAGHLALLPKTVGGGILERLFTGAFGFFLLLGLRAWSISNPRSKSSIGIGAYNLVRLDRYQIAGGHEAIAFDVVDDIKLGMLLKRSGSRQILAHSGGLVYLRWQEGFFASMRGLLKNFFAGFDYSWILVLAATLAFLFLGIVPLYGFLFSTSMSGIIAGFLAIASASLLHGISANGKSGKWILAGVLFPFIECALAATVFTSALLASIRGYVEWRGMRYSLKELKARCVK